MKGDNKKTTAHGEGMTFARRYVGASPITSTTRAINSAGECFLHMEEVRGSNPLLPTKNQAKALSLLGFLKRVDIAQPVERCDFNVKVYRHFLVKKSLAKAMDF